ncbi:2,3-bisphosphoglycerate-independent phosphoglycerate mutase [Candidatus Dojkabacteria bacterium]|nr:2,3-bisphosphoglycerate-independent phosphoglycerate mutase [Candidatus Dojkabacteria bacterium]
MGLLDFLSKKQEIKKLEPAKTVNKDVPLCVLIVLDGLGIWNVEKGNAVLKAKTPNLDTLWTACPHSLLKASGNDVGLPMGSTGNSEVGHLNMGAGQIVYQSLARINDSIRTKQFYNLPNLLEAFNQVKKRGTKLHLFGLASAGAVHSHIEHLFELITLCKKHGVDPFIHPILDGNDTGPRDGFLYLSMLNKQIRDVGVGTIASMSGRFYAMDRSSRWERTQAAYEAMIGVTGLKSTDAMHALQEAYKRGENDDTFTPTIIVDDKGKPVGPIEDNDVVIFFNYREDRARQITKAFVLENWPGTKRVKFLKNLWFLTMTGYGENLPVNVLFESQNILNTVSSQVCNAGFKQLHISETEKGAHVTYFFNGGRENPGLGEEFFIIPSPKVVDFSEAPEMSAEIIRDEVIYRIEMNKYKFILINFANPDMVGHSGNLEASVVGVETVDRCVGAVVKAIIAAGGNFIITADHGNCEVMIDEETGLPDKSHTLNPIPLIIGKQLNQYPEVTNPIKIGTGADAAERGILADVGVTVLSMLELSPAEDMMGMDLYPLLPGVYE